MEFFTRITLVLITFTWSATAEVEFVIPSELQSLNSQLFSSCLQQQIHESASVYVKRDTNSQLYNTLNYQWNTRKRTILPLGYLVARNNLDVQNAIRCGRELKIQIFAKSGGHSYEKYSFGNFRSVVVDLRNMSTVRVNSSDKTAVAGAGILFGPLQWELWVQGKFGIPGPVCESVGVAGLALGGGYGFWSKRFGLTSDYIIEMEMVDAYGKLRIVNEKVNQDLFWALRGAGGGNFGIVTSFKFKLLEVGKLRVTYLLLSYTVDMFKQVFDAWQIFNYGQRDKTPFGRLSVSTNVLTLRIMDVDLSPEDVLALKNKFPTPNSKPSSSSTLNYIELYSKTANNPPMKDVAELGSLTREDVAQRPFRAKSYFSSKVLSDADINALDSVLTRVPTNITIEFSSYAGAVNRINQKDTSYVHRDSLYEVQVGIASGEHDSVANKWVTDFDAVCLNVLDNGESYQNHIDAELKSNYLVRYYGSNLDKLIKIKKEVDPSNYFRFAESIPVSKFW